MTQLSLGNILAQAKDDELTLVPAGDYELEVLSCKPRETDIMPTFRVTAGPYAGKKIMVGALSWNGNGGGIFYRNMIGFGLSEQFLIAADRTGAEIAEALKGRKVVVTLTQEPWNQQMRNKLVPGAVRLVSAPAGSGVPQGVPQAAAQQPAAVVPTAVPATAPVPEPAAPAPQAAADPAPQPGAAVPAPQPVAAAALPAAAPEPNF